MNTQNAPTQYLLLFRGGRWDENLSLDELQKAMEAVEGWFDRLQERGIIKAGQALGKEGKLVSSRNVVDGPFVESKETIGGYLLLEVDSLDEAVAIAKSNPILKYGGTTEVRPALEKCPTFERVKERLALAAA